MKACLSEKSVSVGPPTSCDVLYYYESLQTATGRHRDAFSAGELHKYYTTGENPFAQNQYATRLLDQRHSHSDDYEEAWSSAAASALTPGRPLCSLAQRDGRLYSIDVGRASNDRKDTDLQSK